MKAVYFIIFTFFTISTSCYAQNNVQEYLQAKTDTSSWSCSDSTQLEDYELMVVSFYGDSICHAYLNFIDGFYSNNCSYTAAFNDSYFELEIGGCREPNENIKYVYAYLTAGNNDELNLLLSENKLLGIDIIKKQEGWIQFERFED